MDIIRIQYHDDFDELETFVTIEQAKLCEPVSRVYNRGFAVLFQHEDKFAVYVAYEDRYYYQFLPKGSKVLFGGSWEKHKVVDWQPIRNMSKSEHELLGDQWGFLYGEDATNDER